MAEVEGTDLTPYKVDGGEIRVEGGITWYQASASFYNLVCGPMKDLGEQDGTIYTGMAGYGKPVSMMVAIDTMMGWTQQDDEVWGMWKAHQKDQDDDRNHRITMMMAAPVTPNMVGVVQKILSHALHRVAPKVRDYGDGEDNSDTLYIKKIIDYMINDTETAREFLTEVAGLLVYLDDDDAEIFHRRIREEYYLPDILVTLTPEEKYPEAFTVSPEMMAQNYILLENRSEAIIYFSSNSTSNSRNRFYQRHRIKINISI